MCRTISKKPLTTPFKNVIKRCRIRESSMLDTPSNTANDVRLQSFSIAYEYPVVFTRDAFCPANRCLIDALARREAGKLHRCAIFADDGVLSAIPGLADRISDYASFHARHLKIAGKLVPVPGGERCTNDPDTVPRLLAKFSELAIDRHSFVIAVGGGAVLDAVDRQLREFCEKAWNRSEEHRSE